MTTWIQSRTRLERLILIIACVAVPAELTVKAIGHHRSYGDFNLHLDFGKRFLAGQPLYTNNMCFNYMPVSALYYAPLSLLPTALASLVRTTAALACLFGSLSLLGAMVQPRARPGAWRGLTLAALTVLLTLQYILRDLDDGGPHLIYLGLLVGSLACVQWRREWLAAAGFGLVIALKMTPGLILPFFVWKRQWRLAALTALATAGWIVLPAVWMGPSSWWRQQQQWNRVAFNVAAERLDAERVKNEVRVQNQSLKQAVARWLVAYPAGHALKVNSPLDVAFLNVAPATANRLGTLAAVALLAAVAWWSRRPFSGPDDPAWPVELAAVLVLVPLLSPVTWLQHLVFVIPAVYLLIAGHRAFRPLGPAALTALGLFVLFATILNRGIVGRDCSLILYSYHIHTFSLLLVLGLVIARRPTQTTPRTTGGRGRMPRVSMASASGAFCPVHPAVF